MKSAAAWQWQWDEAFDDLLAYKRKYRHVDGPFRVHFPRLSLWVTKQRRYYRKGKLPRDRVERLERIGFTWEGDRSKRGLGGAGLAPLRKRNKRRHDLHMQERLQAYLTEHGHCRVMGSQDEPLYRWLTELPRRQHAGTLPVTIQAAVKRAGVPFTADDTLWEKRFATVAERVKQGKGFTAGSPTQIGPWMAEQRRLSDGGKLLPARAQRLAAIGFFEPAASPVRKAVLRSQRRHEVWLAKLDAWKRWRARAADGAPRPRRLKHWIGDQLKQRGERTADRVRLLREAGFPLDGEIDTRWETNLHLLKQFAARHGHTRVPRTNRRLGLWTQLQRTLGAKGQIPAERKAQLDALHFDWVPAETSWQKMVQRLTAFHARFGHGNVERTWPEDAELGKWLNMVRAQARHGDLSDSVRKIAQLTALGVDWDGASIRRRRAFETLEAFWRAHGHCHPKQGEDAVAQNGARRFRRARAARELSAEWIRRLDALGFIWEARPAGGGGRTGRLPELLAFYRKHGHCYVPDHGKSRELYAWAEGVRTQHAEGELAPKLLAQLRELAFPLDTRELAWERSFARLVSLARGGRGLPSPGHPLGAWARTQLALAERGELSPERADRFAELLPGGLDGTA